MSPRAWMASAASPIDQVFSSVSNGLVLFAFAVVATVHDFGVISLLFTVTATAIGMLRGALGTPLLLEAGAHGTEIRRHGRHAVAAAAIFGLAGAPILAAAGLVLGDAQIAWAIALALPLLLMQDTLRYVAISMGRAPTAATWDGLWCGGSLALLVLAWFHLRWLTPVAVILGWVFFATVSLVGLGASLRVRPLVVGTGPWFRRNWRDRLRYGIDAGLEQATFFIVLLIGTVFVGYTAVAALRGATAALAPLAILASSIPLLVIPTAARSSMAPRAIWRILAKVAAATSACALAAGVTLHFVPEQIGALLLGDSYEAARDVVLLVAAEYSMTAWAFVIGVYLRSQNRSAEVLRLKCFAVSVTITGSLVGALLIGTPVGLATFYFLATVVIVAVALVWFSPWRTTPWRFGVSSPPRLTDAKGS